MTQEPKQAATVILLNESENGLQVFMQERHRDSKGFASMLVFPGGKVDDSDRQQHWVSYCPASEASDPEQLAHKLAVIRESYEESGVLLARRAGGEVLAGEEVAAYSDQPQALQSGELDFFEFMRAEGLEPALDLLGFFAHWITPEFEKRRFDTRFYIAEVPEAQRDELGHDGFETVDSVWILPADAIADGKVGRRKLIFPTIRNLELLAGFNTMDEALAAGKKPGIRPILPTVDLRDSGVYVTIPEDSGYPVCEERIPDEVVKMLSGGK